MNLEEIKEVIYGTTTIIEVEGTPAGFTTISDHDYTRFLYLQKHVPALITYIEQLEKTIEIDSVGRDILEANQTKIGELEAEVERLKKDIFDTQSKYLIPAVNRRDKAEAETEQLQVKLDAAIALSKTSAKMADVVKEVYETHLTRIREAAEDLEEQIKFIQGVNYPYRSKKGDVLDNRMTTLAEAIKEKNGL